ncbi:hypothetical protein LY90DRAFT_437460, partial [Neocallimastix californiae]
ILKKLIEHKHFPKQIKCELQKLKISFLGNVVSNDGVENDPKKVKDIKESFIQRT